MDGSSHATFETCGVKIAALSEAGAVQRVIDLAQGGAGAAVHLCNAYTLALATRDGAYREVLNNGELNLPDGAPVAWVGRRLGFDVRAPVRGKDLFMGVVREGREAALRHYLYGSTSEVVARSAVALKESHPGAFIVGAEPPPFRALTIAETSDLVARLAEARPQIVWVGLGTPKQDEFAERMKTLYPATFVAVGAAFDFLAGSKREAPRWIRGTGLEWVHRLATEPGRLWRRYLIGNTVFMVAVSRQLLGSKRS